MSSSTSRASDSNCHGSAVRDATGGVGEDRRRAERPRSARGRGRGRTSRPPRRCRPATASGRRRRPGRGRCRRRRSDPRRRSAMRQSPCSWRDIPAARRFSRRSSIHFSGHREPASPPGRCTCPPASGTTFWPNPPPVSRMMHPHLVLADAEQPGQEHPHLVGRLGRGPHRQLLARPLGDHAPGLHRYRGVGLLVDRQSDVVGGRLEHTGQVLRQRATEGTRDVVAGTRSCTSASVPGADR